MESEHIQSAPPDRRSFLKKAITVISGAVAVLPAIGAGLIAFLDPLRRRGSQGLWARVASLEALPADGIPRKFTVFMDHVDAWNKAKNVPVGAVYLRRIKEQEVQALNVVCPHAGCFVELKKDAYGCPCHNSSFDLDGSIRDPKSPSPRALDKLAVELRNGSEVWVQFQNFQAGKKEKVPVG
jgi:menaquinol-cytochrome c reductase iron-sulfur subunit